MTAGRMSPLQMLAGAITGAVERARRPGETALEALDREISAAAGLAPHLLARLPAATTTPTLERAA